MKRTVKSLAELGEDVVLAPERWVATEKTLTSSTSSPQKSMRTGWCPWAGKTSTMPPRTAISPLASTRSVRW